MILSESYLFVLIINSWLFVPFGLSLRTLLRMRQHVILPILRLRITHGLTEKEELSNSGRSIRHSRKASPSIQSGRHSW